MKISFDFDHTLSTPTMQKLAKLFKSKGHDTYLTTSRFKLSPFYSNERVYNIAESVGIPKENIRFTNGKDKYNFLREFDIHFDDDIIQIELINDLTECVGILYGE